LIGYPFMIEISIHPFRMISIHPFLMIYQYTFVDEEFQKFFLHQSHNLIGYPFMIENPIHQFFMV
jgi:hypothetical protein